MSFENSNTRDTSESGHLCVGNTNAAKRNAPPNENSANRHDGRKKRYSVSFTYLSIAGALPSPDGAPSTGASASPSLAMVEACFEPYSAFRGVSFVADAIVVALLVRSFRGL